MNADPKAIDRRARQRRTVILLATFLIAGGLLMLLVLKRAPLPSRILAGLTDIVAGCVLLVLVRQKNHPRPPG